MGKKSCAPPPLNYFKNTDLPPLTENPERNPDRSTYGIPICSTTVKRGQKLLLGTPSYMDYNYIIVPIVEADFSHGIIVHARCVALISTLVLTQF